MYFEKGGTGYIDLSETFVVELVSRAIVYGPNGTQIQRNGPCAFFGGTLPLCPVRSPLGRLGAQESLEIGQHPWCDLCDIDRAPLGVTLQRVGGDPVVFFCRAGIHLVRDLAGVSDEVEPEPVREPLGAPNPLHDLPHVHIVSPQAEAGDVAAPSMDGFVHQVYDGGIFELQFLRELARNDNGVCGYVAYFSPVSNAYSNDECAVAAAVLFPDEGLKSGGHDGCGRNLVNNSKTFLHKCTHFLCTSVYVSPEILRLIYPFRAGVTT